MDALSSRLDELSIPEKCDDWAAKLQHLCIDMWKFLDGPDVPSESNLMAFVHLLQDEASFRLARLVIPDLRAAEELQAGFDCKKKVLQALRSAHTAHYHTLIPVHIAMDALSSRLDELSIPEKCDDWAAKLQHLCIDMWKFLDGPDVPSESNLMAFVHLLQDEASFRLARLVIPDLRAAEELQAGFDCKKKVLQALRSAHTAHYHTLEGNKQDCFDTTLYAAEKRILAEMNILRAKLLFLNKLDLSQDEEMAFTQWYDSCPIAIKDEKDT